MKQIILSILSLCVYFSNAIAQDPMCAYSSLQKTSASESAAAAKRFPVEGTVNALIVFVQHQDDNSQDCRQLTSYNSLGVPQWDESPNYSTYCSGSPDSNVIGGYQSWNEDASTEWPANLPAGPDPARTRQLPSWAGSLFSGSDSLTDFYDSMSNGKLTLTGEVWDYTYIPQHPRGWYANSQNNAPYGNGLVKLSQEILEYVELHPHGINLSDPKWDLYTNGDGLNATPDSIFDMIILVYRNASLSTVAPNFFPSGSGATTLGTRGLTSGNSFANAPVTLGGYQVIDNEHEGSGVIVGAYSKKMVMRLIAHEIGHRQFGLDHADSGGAASSRSDYFSIMVGSPHLSFSAGDRVKLGWANIEYVNVANISPTQNYTLRDAAVSNSSETDV